jgi:hypothetical protein
MVQDASATPEEQSAIQVYKPSWAAAEAVLLTRWMTVALNAGFLAALATLIGIGSARRSEPIVVGISVGAAILVTVAALAPRVKIVVEPSRLVVVNLFRRHVVDANAITSIK